MYWEKLTNSFNYLFIHWRIFFPCVSNFSSLLLCIVNKVDFFRAKYSRRSDSLSVREDNPARCVTPTSTRRMGVTFEDGSGEAALQYLLPWSADAADSVSKSHWSKLFVASTHVQYISKGYLKIHVAYTKSQSFFPAIICQNCIPAKDWTFSGASLNTDDPLEGNDIRKKIQDRFFWVSLSFEKKKSLF